MGTPDFELLKSHVGHRIVCEAVVDPRADIEDGVRLRCADCDVLLVDADLEDDCVEWYVWCLTIMHPTGTEFFIFNNSARARDQLYLYVKDNWASEFPDEEMPALQDDAIDEYFADNERESYILTEQPVLCEAE